MKAWICKNRNCNKVWMFFDKPEKHWKRVRRDNPDVWTTDEMAEDGYPFWSSWNYSLSDERKIIFSEDIESYRKKGWCMSKEKQQILELDPQWEDDEPIEIDLNYIPQE